LRVLKKFVSPLTPKVITFNNISCQRPDTQTIKIH
jgi:hypothetical protein